MVVRCSELSLNVSSFSVLHPHHLMPRLACLIYCRDNIKIYIQIRTFYSFNSYRLTLNFIGQLDGLKCFLHRHLEFWGIYKAIWQAVCSHVQQHRLEDWRRTVRCFVGRFERQRPVGGLADRERERVLAGNFQQLMF